MALSFLVGAAVVRDSTQHAAVDSALGELRQEHALATALVSERLETQQRRLQILARYARRHLDFGANGSSAYDAGLDQFSLTEQGQLFRPVSRGGAALYGEFAGPLSDEDRDAGRRRRAVLVLRRASL